MGTVGRIHPHLEARVVDPQTGRTLPRGQVGGTLLMARMMQCKVAGQPMTDPHTGAMHAAGWAE